MIDLVIAVGILGWFVGACFFIWDDITRLCDRMVAEDVGADSSRGLLGAGHSDVPGADLPGPRSGSRASCVGRTGRIEGQVTFPREWVVGRSRPYDRETDTA